MTSVLDNFKNVIGVLIIMGLLLTGLAMFIHPFIMNYEVSDPELNQYNELDTMLTQTANLEDDLKGLNSNSSMWDLAEFIVSSAYTTFVNGLSSIPILGALLVSLSEAVGMPVIFVTGIISIIILSVVISLAYFFIQVIRK